MKSLLSGFWGHPGGRSLWFTWVPVPGGTATGPRLHSGGDARVGRAPTRCPSQRQLADEEPESPGAPAPQRPPESTPSRTVAAASRGMPALSSLLGGSGTTAQSEKPPLPGPRCALWSWQGPEVGAPGRWGTCGADTEAVLEAHPKPPPAPALGDWHSTHCSRPHLCSTLSSLSPTAECRCRRKIPKGVDCPHRVKVSSEQSDGVRVPVFFSEGQRSTSTCTRPSTLLSVHHPSTVHAPSTNHPPSTHHPSIHHPPPTIHHPPTIHPPSIHPPSIHHPSTIHPPFIIHPPTIHYPHTFPFSRHVSCAHSGPCIPTPQVIHDS